MRRRRSHTQPRTCRMGKSSERNFRCEWIPSSPARGSGIAGPGSSRHGACTADGWREKVRVQWSARPFEFWIYGPSSHVLLFFPALNEIVHCCRQIKCHQFVLPATSCRDKRCHHCRISFDCTHVRPSTGSSFQRRGRGMFDVRTDQNPARLGP